MNKIIKRCVLTALSNQWQIEPIKDESLQPGRGGLVTSHTAEDDGREIGLHSALNWCFNGFFIVSSWICFGSFLGRRQILGFSKCKIHLQKNKTKKKRGSGCQRTGCNKLRVGVEQVVPLRADWLPLPVGCLIRKWHAHFYLAPLHAGYSDVGR